MKRIAMTIIMLMVLSGTARAVDICQVQYLMGVGKSGDRLKVEGTVTATGTVITGAVTCNAGSGWGTGTLATAANQVSGNASLTSIDGKITACNTGAVAGTVTANAGTNLNTSLLALESGNLLSIATSTAAIAAGGSGGGGWSTQTESIATSTAYTALNGSTAARQDTAILYGYGVATSTYSAATATALTASNTTSMANSAASILSGMATAANQTTANAYMLSAATSTARIASDTTYIANNLNRVSGRNMKATDTSFVVGDSGVLVDVNAALGRNGSRGFIANDGAGNFYVEISDDGSTFGGAFEMTSGEVFPVDGIDVDTIRITWIANSAYRIAIWP